MSPPTSTVALHMHVCSDSCNINSKDFFLIQDIKCFFFVFFGKMEIITILTFWFKWLIFSLHLETIFDRELHHIVLWLSELVDDYQRNTRPPVLVVIQKEDVKREESSRYIVPHDEKKGSPKVLCWQEWTKQPGNMPLDKYVANTTTTLKNTARRMKSDQRHGLLSYQHSASSQSALGTWLQLKMNFPIMLWLLVLLWLCWAVHH